jgi:hypothetical protein
MAKTTYPGVGDNSPAARAQRETHWRRLIDRWRASGQPKSAFCEREGVSDAAMHWWMRQLERRDGRGRSKASAPAPRKPAKPKFVPLRVVTSSSSGTQPFELVVAGKVVRVPQGFDPETLRQLIAALEDQAC